MYQHTRTKSTCGSIFGILMNPNSSPSPPSHSPRTNRLLCLPNFRSSKQRKHLESDSEPRSHEVMSGPMFQARQRLADHDPANIDQIKADVRNGDYEDRLPQDENVEEAATCEVINAENQSIPFSSLYERQGDSKRQRHLFIFVRHFFCGVSFAVSFTSHLCLE